MKMMHALAAASAGLAFTCLSFISSGHKSAANHTHALEQELKEAVRDRPGRIGVAVIIGGRDTVAVNNTPDYPLMSMFKLHEALAVCHTLDMQGVSLDSVLAIDRKSLNPDTWSPMLKDYGTEDFTATVGRLLEYILIDSDNNASNLLFDRIVSVDETDRFVRRFTSGDFRLVHKESDMQEEHARSYDNRTSPLAYAELVNKVFTDSVVSRDKQEFVKRAMAACGTGTARIAAGLAGTAGVEFAHRNGSGYVNGRGEVIAVNDGGYVRLPSGECYSIAVFIKDWAGPQEEAEKAMAEISGIVCRYVSRR